MTVGVLLTAFGWLEDLDDVDAYLGNIMGREPPDRAVEHLRSRYEAIGGPGPLGERTRAQRDALQAALGDGFIVRLGLRYSAPFVPDAAERLGAHDAVDHVVVVALAPQWNTHSVRAYLEQAREGLRRLDDPPPAAFVESYATHPDLVAYWADAVEQGLAELPPKVREEARVVLTAHSLPASVVDDGDPYPDECRATCEAVAAAAGLQDWTLAYQSGHEGWLGPDVEEDLPAIAEGAAGLVVAPVGFVSEHLETLDDLDRGMAGEAAELGLPFVRVPAPDDDPRYVRCLADVVRSHLPEPR